ncbi:hypothetical protein D9758_012617 [Tetrapyrgos nigripes]|uniref:Protein kinase domain-containing protein n=1 Tax=Tetrapyrgos nigripes TaxID=182062 RepID=A0A8H5LMH6_9AGAR|nr:hypothetical protein D9758_012617 [Tetrapyrgos nigripes]
MISTALKLASKWKWSARDAKALVENIKDYNLCKAPFIGGTKDGKAYWESLSVASDQVPLKKLAITIFLIVPSSSDVERLFSDLGGIQTPKRNNLNINTFEDLGKMHCNLRRHHHSELRAQGKSIHRKHGHMHTKTSPGINTAIVEEGSVTESDNWQGPLEVDEEQVEEEDVEASFDSLEKQIEVEKDIELELELEEELTTLDIVEGKLYDFTASTSTSTFTSTQQQKRQPTTPPRTHSSSSLSASWQKRKPKTQTSLPLNPLHFSPLELHFLFSDIISGLDFLHSRLILHLDMKPGNVLLRWKEGGLLLDLPDVNTYGGVYSGEYENGYDGYEGQGDNRDNGDQDDYTEDYVDGDNWGYGEEVTYRGKGKEKKE